MSSGGQHVSHVEHLTLLCCKNSASTAGTGEGGHVRTENRRGSVGATGLWPQDARALVPWCPAAWLRFSFGGRDLSVRSRRDLPSLCV